MLSFSKHAHILVYIAVKCLVKASYFLCTGGDGDGDGDGDQSTNCYPSTNLIASTATF